MLAPTDILGRDGRVAAQLSHHEHRQEQLEMSEFVAAAWPSVGTR